MDGGLELKGSVFLTSRKFEVVMRALECLSPSGQFSALPFSFPMTVRPLELLLLGTGHLAGEQM